MNFFPDSNIELIGEHISYNDLLPIAQKYVKNFDGLVLIREKELPMKGRKRATGTLWYKNQLLGFTVEDITREKKIQNKTAIPANLTFISPPTKGYYNIVLDTTGNDFIKKNYVKFPNDNRRKFRNPGVLIRVGTSEDAKTLYDNPNLSFDGIRIHSGTSERNSAGCLIYSSQRNEDGTLKNDIEINQEFIKYVYYNNINKIVYIDYFDLVDNTDYNLQGKVVDLNLKTPIKGAQIKIQSSYNSSTPESLKGIYTFNGSTTTNENGEFNIPIPPILEYILSTQSKNIGDPNSSIEVSIYAKGHDEKEKNIIDSKGNYTPNLGIIELPVITKLNLLPLSEMTLENETPQYREILNTPEVEINSKLTKQKGKLNDLVKNIRDNIITTFFS
jgi:hypothetical protein